LRPDVIEFLGGIENARRGKSPAIYTPAGRLPHLWSNSGQNVAMPRRTLSAISGLMHRSKLNLYLIASAGISVGEAAPEQHTKQHKIRHICIIVF
jgi:hypothetical protein